MLIHINFLLKNNQKIVNMIVKKTITGKKSPRNEIIQKTFGLIKGEIRENVRLMRQIRFVNKTTYEISFFISYFLETIFFFLLLLNFRIQILIFSLVLS